MHLIPPAMSSDNMCEMLSTTDAHQRLTTQGFSFGTNHIGTFPHPRLPEAKQVFSTNDFVWTVEAYGPFWPRSGRNPPKIQMSDACRDQPRKQDLLRKAVSGLLCQLVLHDDLIGPTSPIYHGRFLEMNNAHEHIKGFEKYCNIKDWFFFKPFPKLIWLSFFIWNTYYILLDSGVPQNTIWEILN